MYTESAGTTYIVSCSAATAEIFDQNLMLLGKFTPDQLTTVVKNVLATTSDFKKADDEV